MDMHFDLDEAFVIIAAEAKPFAVNSRFARANAQVVARECALGNITTRDGNGWTDTWSATLHGRELIAYLSDTEDLI